MFVLFSFTVRLCDDVFSCMSSRAINSLKNSIIEIRLDAMKYVHFQTGAIPKTAAARGGGGVARNFGAACVMVSS